VQHVELLFYFVLYKVTVPTLFGVIVVVGLLGNLLVVGVTLSRHKMWTTVNLLLLNLAVTDVIFVLVCVPFMAYHYAADNWLIGDAVCKLSQFFLYVTSSRSETSRLRTASPKWPISCHQSSQPISWLVLRKSKHQLGRETFTRSISFSTSRSTSPSTPSSLSQSSGSLVLLCPIHAARDADSTRPSCRVESSRTV